MLVLFEITERNNTYSDLSNTWLPLLGEATASIVRPCNVQRWQIRQRNRHQEIEHKGTNEEDDSGNAECSRHGEGYGEEGRKAPSELAKRPFPFQSNGPSQDVTFSGRVLTSSIVSHAPHHAREAIIAV